MRPAILVLSVSTLLFLAGCLGNFAANQGRKQAARSSDHYLKKYAEPALTELYGDDPDAKVEVRKVSREGRNWLADVIVHSNGEKTRRKVLVDSKGRILEER